jgi:hypothetical protein
LELAEITDVVWPFKGDGDFGKCEDWRDDLEEPKSEH